eukprot:Nk52_evm7s696 gene=Nk52_evmTU7s696
MGGMGIKYKREIEIESKGLITTGGHTWDAAHVLFDFLESIDICSMQRGIIKGKCSEDDDDVCRCEREKGMQGSLKILELGSGCAWFALNLGNNFVYHYCDGDLFVEEEGKMTHAEKGDRYFTAVEIVATEQEGDAFEWMDYNIQKQSHKLYENLGSQIGKGEEFVMLQSRTLDWTAFPSVNDSTMESGYVGDFEENFQPDLLLGSDLIYNSIGTDYFPSVVKHFLKAAGAGTEKCCIYVHTFHRYDILDEIFLANLEKLDLQVDEFIKAPNQTDTDKKKNNIQQFVLQPIQEVFLEELFPEKRIAILYIRNKTPNAASDSTDNLTAHMKQRGNLL